MFYLRDGSRVLIKTPVLIAAVVMHGNRPGSVLSELLSNGREVALDIEPWKSPDTKICREIRHRADRRKTRRTD